MSTEKSVQPVGPALIRNHEWRGSVSPVLHIVAIMPDWFSRSLVMSMDQLNGIGKWIRLGGFPQLILFFFSSLFSLCICHFTHSSFLCLLPLPFSPRFLSYIRAVCFLLHSSYSADNWTGLPELPDFSSLWSFILNYPFALQNFFVC